MELWRWSLKKLNDTEMKARIWGVKFLISTFGFVFCCFLGECLLKKTDNLNKALQRQDISAAEGQNLASPVFNVLAKSRSSEIYEQFWERAMKWKTQLGAPDP